MKIENKILTGIILVGLLLIVAVGAKSETKDAISDYIAHATKDHNNPRAQEFVQPIHRAAERYKQDPLLIATTIKHESNFKLNQIGTAGEVGLTQIKKYGVCAKGQNLKTSQGQITAASYCYSLAAQYCKADKLQMISWYMSGKCVSESKRTQNLAKKRLIYYKKMKTMFQ